MAIFGYLAGCQVGYPSKEYYVVCSSEALTFGVYDTPVKIDGPKLICGNFAHCISRVSKINEPGLAPHEYCRPGGFLGIEFVVDIRQEQN